jgi:hypothetical protein
LEAELLVGIGIDPGDLGRLLLDRIVGVGRRPIVEREHALRPPLDRLETCVGSDREQPGAQRASTLEAGHAAPGRQERLLHRVFGVRGRAEHPVAVRLQRLAVRFDELSEGALVAADGLLEQRCLGHWGGS